MGGVTEWTLDELVRRVDQALAAADVRAPNGRVTEVPDGRMIRWYATIGVVDRPSAMRGRSARYGPRHLLQLVAVKRLQAGGQSLAEIQHSLAGASNADLGRLADIPPYLLDAPSEVDDADWHPEPAASTNSHRRFWAEAPTEAPTEMTPTAATEAAPDGVLHGVALADGVVVLLPAPPNPDDVAAIRAASGPLIETLSRRGLTTRHQP